MFAPAARDASRRRHQTQRARQRRAHPSGAPGTELEAVHWPAQFKLRTPEAIWHVRACERPSQLGRDSREANLLRDVRGDRNRAQLEIRP
eukprot:1003840-Alexandrium_andersonii.AAC.1